MVEVTSSPIFNLTELLTGPARGRHLHASFELARLSRLYTFLKMLKLFSSAHGCGIAFNRPFPFVPHRLWVRTSLKSTATWRTRGSRTRGTSAAVRRPPCWPPCPAESLFFECRTLRAAPNLLLRSHSAANYFIIFIEIPC